MRPWERNMKRTSLYLTQEQVKFIQSLVALNQAQNMAHVVRIALDKFIKQYPKKAA